METGFNWDEMLETHGPEHMRALADSYAGFQPDYAMQIRTVLWRHQQAEQEKLKIQSLDAIAAAKESAQHAKSSAFWTMVAAIATAVAAFLTLASNLKWFE